MCKSFWSLPIKLLILVFILSTSYFIQADSSKASAYYEDAVKYYSNEKYSESVIQLKNALKEDSRLLPAIVLLGKAYLKTGNPAAAETAFNDAINAGADPSLVIIPRAQSYLIQFKHDLLLAEAVPQDLPDNVLAELHTIRAGAALATNNQKMLTQELASAEAVNPEHAGLLFLRMTMAVDRGEIIEAERHLRRLKVLYPDQEVTLLAQASISHVKGDLNTALNEYSVVIKAYPKLKDARLSRVGILFDLGRHSEAKEDLNALVDQASADPRVNYLRAIMLEKEGKIDKRSEYLNEALIVLDALGPKIVLGNQQFTLIAGMANSKLGKTEAARAYLESYLKAGGNDPSARMVLAKTYAKTKEYRDTIKLTESLLKEGQYTLELIQVTTSAYHAIGDHKKAVQLLERITRALTNSTVLNVQLALSRIRAGYTRQGVAELEALYLNKDIREYTAMPLAITYLDLLAFDKAYDIAKDLLKKNDQELAHLNLMGLVEVGRGNAEKAKKYFEQVLDLDPKNIAAHINIAKLDVREGKFDTAITRLNKLENKHPSNVQVLLELSRAYRIKKDFREALKWARVAYKSDPGSLFISKHFIDLLLATDSIKEASSIALELEQLRPNDLNVLEVNIKVLQAQKKTSQLQSQLREMAGLAALNPEWLVKIARYQSFITNDLDGASYTLFKALQENPQNLDARILMIEVETQLKRLDAAKERARLLIADNPNLDIGYILLADILSIEQKYPLAIKNYIQASKKQNKSSTLLKLYSAQRNSGNFKAAQASLTGWLKKNPNDQGVREALAEYYLGTGSPKLAKQEYQWLIQKGVNTPRLFNNLANTLIKLKDFDDAFNYAQKAYTLAPKDALINDTLGWILTINSKHEEGIGYLREALTRASTNPEIRYHLGVNLAGQNRIKESASELSIALASKTNFEGRKEATKLLQKIKNGQIK